MLDHRIATFITLYREMNYRKTAQALNMTQPGVTQHIQYLEKHYGVKLFAYDGRRLTRTGEAEALKRYFDRALAQERTLREEFSRPAGVHLEIGATKTIGEFVLTPVVSRFLAAKDHTLSFVIDNTENLLHELERSRLDFAVIEGVFDKKKYGCHLYKKEAYVGICAKEHPFAGQTVPFSEVFHQTLVVRECGSGTRLLLEQAISDRGYSLSCFDRSVSISNFSVIRDIVSQGNAITFGYAPVVADREDLAAFEVEDMHITGEFNFVYCDEDAAKEKIGLFFGDRSLPNASATTGCAKK